jgi:hypothetical protein
MPEMRALDREAAKQQPQSVFKSPLEIVGEILLTKGEKLATLKRWRRSVLEELEAANEGLPTRGYTRDRLAVLEEIETAQTRLSTRVRN